jgi:hypothetical protein
VRGFNAIERKLDAGGGDGIAEAVRDQAAMELAQRPDPLVQRAQTGPCPSFATGAERSDKFGVAGTLALPVCGFAPPRRIWICATAGVLS